MRVPGWLFGLIGVLCFSVVTHGEQLNSSLQDAYARYAVAKSNYLARAGETEAASKFAKACAEGAESAENNEQRATVAEEGIAAARFVTDIAPTNAAGFYYLALNYGELARTKSIGALSLVKKMEHAFLQAIQLDPPLEHGGPDRSLGMLYRDAPGRPASIGNRSKAREH